jgi:type VI secretion system secreted protein Hcp
VSLTDQGVTTEGSLGKPETTNVNAFHFTAPPAATPDSAPQVPDGSALRYFLKVAGVTGDSTDKDHKGWFAVDGFDFGATRSGGSAGAASGAGAGKVTFSPLSVDIDSLTGLAPLLNDQNKGADLKSVELVGVTSSDQTVYDLKLTNAVLFMVQNMASLTGSGGVETGLSFAFNSATLTDHGINSEGGLGAAQTVSFNAQTNKIG